MIEDKLDKIKEYFIRKSDLCLFLFLMFVYMSLALFNSYFCDAVTELNFGLAYGIDTGKIFKILYLDNGFATIKHPVIQIVVCPIIAIFRMFIENPKFIMVVLHSIAQSLVGYFIYKILLILTSKKYIALLFGLIFGFSFTAILFVIFPDVYIWAGLTQVIFLYYIVSLYKNDRPDLSFKNIIILSILSVLCYAINIINIISCIVLIIFILFEKYKKYYSHIAKNFIKVLLTTGIFIFLMQNLQNMVFHHYHYTKGAVNINYSYKNKKAVNIIEGTWIEPFYSLKSEISSNKCKRENYKTNEIIYINVWKKSYKQNIVMYLPALFILFFPICFYYKNKNKYSNKSLINILLFVFGLYTTFNYPFYSWECALFALNYFSLLVVLLGLMYEKIKSFYNYIILGLFLIFEITVNIYNLFKIHGFLNIMNNQSPSLLVCMLYSLGLVITCSIVFKTVKFLGIKNNISIEFKDKFLFYLSLYIGLMLFYSIFKYGFYLLGKLC